MIHLFNSRGRILFFPVRWANSVSSWILGLHSPSGTLRIANTANPSDSGGATVDVDMEVVAAKTRERLDGHFLGKKELETEIVRMIDGSSIVSRDRKILVNEDWLQQRLDEVEGSDSSVTPATFQLEAVKNSSGTVTGMKYYVADTAKAVTVHGVAYTITGAAAGWNTLSRTGAIYLNQSAENATTLAVGASATSTARCFSIFVGSVAADGTVTQNVLGAVNVANARMGLSSPGAINGPEDPTAMTSGYKDTWTEGTHKPHGSSGTTAGVGVSVPVCTGAAVDAFGTMISLRFRLLTFDRSGRLYSVGAETQEITFEP